MGNASYCNSSVGADYYSNHFYAKPIKNNRVEYELAYAKAGSNIPQSLHGVFWMDMFYQSSVAKDPAYENKPWWIKELQKVIPHVAPSMVVPDLETLICFGDYPTTWVPDKRMLQDVGYCGEKGHWTYPNVAFGKAQAFDDILNRTNADFIFENEEMTEIYVSPRVRDPITGSWTHAPRFMFEMLMFKTEWGWNRKTTCGNVAGAIVRNDILAQILPVSIIKLVQSGETPPDAWNYPMVQIVDGDGKRTKYYDEYLQFMSIWGSDEQIVIARAKGSCGYCYP